MSDMTFDKNEVTKAIEWLMKYSDDKDYQKNLNIMFVFLNDTLNTMKTMTENVVVLNREQRRALKQKDFINTYKKVTEKNKK